MTNIRYEQTENLKVRKAYQMFDGENFVGSVEGAGNNQGHFISVVMLDPNYHKKGIGFQAFNKMFNEINENYPITKIIGSWHKNDEYTDFENGMSTNLRMFFQNPNNQTDIESAKNTPTGKWAKELGFEKCEIISKSTEEVIVHFTK
jgi:hypothetical protein